MPALTFGLSSYERALGGLADLPVENMYAEESDTEGVALVSRPGLSDRSADMGSSAVEALFKRDGVVSGNLLGVAGGRLYDGTTDEGAIAGSGAVSIAGNETGVMIAAGGSLYGYTGTGTLAAIAFPDSANVIKVIEGVSRFIAIRADSGRSYFTPPLGRTFGALDFATAESESDQLLDALFIDDQIVFFGAETVEFWPSASDANTPFVPLQGRVYERGIKATGCATAIGSSFAWVTDQNTVCIQDENNIVSNQGLEARIAASTNVRAFNFFIDGAEFLCIRLDNETQAYNLRTGTWSKLSSVGQSNWIPQCHAAGVFGSSIDGKTLEFGSDFQDLAGPMTRLFRAGMQIDGGASAINRLTLRSNPGNTPFLAGNYTNPEVEMRYSRDQGNTWNIWRSVGLGVQGIYNQRMDWRALGMAHTPGFLAEFRVTDPVDFRVSGVHVNEAYGGR